LLGPGPEDVVKEKEEENEGKDEEVEEEEREEDKSVSSDAHVTWSNNNPSSSIDTGNN